MTAIRTRIFPGIALLALTLGPRRDLDVALPPGSPIDWIDAIPVLTPPRERLQPLTPGPIDSVPADQRTVAAPRVAREQGALSNFGLIRILTWDLTAHLPWVHGKAEPPAQAITGFGPDVPPTPAVSRPLYWIALAPLLRQMLHPARVSRHETMAHLLELGEPTLAVLDGAAADQALRELCQELKARIRMPSGAGPVPRPGATPYDTMLQRFVFKELLVAHPFDPEAGFGARLFLLGERVLPALATYATADHPFLRRNAVAALARLHSPAAGEALFRTALTSTDLVARVRALHALGRKRHAPDLAALLVRLGSTQDRAEAAALVHLCGDLGDPSAVPALLTHLRARVQDPDALLTGMMALARMPPGAHTAALLEYAGNLQLAVRANPAGYRPRHEASPNAADLPDPPDLRASMLDQLALLVRARQKPADPQLATLLLELVDPQAANRRPLQRSEQGQALYTNQSLQGVHPVAWFLFLDALARMDERGMKRLELIARDPTVEPELRGRALDLLAAGGNTEAAEQLFGAAEPDEMTAYAMAALDRHGHPRIEELARSLISLPMVVRAARDGLARSLLVMALQSLESRGKLTERDLQPLLSRIERRPPAFRPPAEELRERVEHLVDRAAHAAPQAELHRETEALFELALALRASPRVTKENRTAMVRQIEALLSQCGRRRNDTEYLRTVVETIAEYLIGAPQDALLASVEFRPIVPLEETALLALGKLKGSDPVPVLARLLRQKDNPYRPVLCLALGLTRTRTAAPHLVPALLDEEPFVRLCAYEALRQLTGQEFFADWLYGKAGERADAADRYAAWIATHR